MRFQKQPILLKRSTDFGSAVKLIKILLSIYPGNVLGRTNDHRLQNPFFEHLTRPGVRKTFETVQAFYLFKF
jgi:hypothetical protein